MLLLRKGDSAGSLPPREAWIEIPLTRIRHLWMKWSLPPREAWIEIASTVPTAIPMTSLPPREAWIEIHVLDL